MATATQDVEVNVITDQDGVTKALRAAYDSRRPVFPAGGRTGLDYGGTAPPTEQLLGLTGLNRVIDYTPRDITIVVEAGIRMADLNATLAAERQQLRIDVLRAAEASIGGVVATGWTGGRRLGHGMVRDYVIGIHTVDGRGIALKGGGRVVKNVAGYDVCKLLTGSLGTLGVLMKFALKVKPQPECSATVVAACQDVTVAETILARLIRLPAPPTAVDLLVGSAWGKAALPGNDRSCAMLVVRVDSTEAEAKWLVEKVHHEFRQGGASDAQHLCDVDANRLWTRQIEFSDRGAAAKHDEAALVLKVAVPSSTVVETISDLRSHDRNCLIQAYAASGTIVARFAGFAASDVSTVLIGRLRPAAIHRGGSLVALASKLEGLTPQTIWDGRSGATILMERIKHQFDLRNILDPGRFAYYRP